LAVVLTLTLTGQYLVQDRDRLVAYVPSLRPAINAACGLFQCRIKPWRQIEQITIEGSAFSKVRSDLFRLNLTLHNAATVPLAAPAVELTLTDAMDQVLVRRVLQPEELGAVEGVLTVGSDYQSSLLLNVTSGILADRIVGYRLLAFYP
jgi:hypothetical protein